ncbi:unnamed protein product [Lepeophtheirus salmonis]|uniref:(salmon louse) hypothetical protein n=1 Tax=Lepeophtheirus salmonis TaxID=72036 RepID=A0A7R8D9H8_LEPSM|nr:unnamed protein product [Lepeophtheirus salmonis]CAF3044978.1 unnamed protein product [Lepeophtheirus salmonis]
MKGTVLFIVSLAWIATSVSGVPVIQNEETVVPSIILNEESGEGNVTVTVLETMDRSYFVMNSDDESAGLPVPISEVVETPNNDYIMNNPIVLNEKNDVILNDDVILSGEDLTLIENPTLSLDDLLVEEEESDDVILN